MNKTLLVGLDAACWEYLKPLLDAGRMPILQGLIDNGGWGTLRSTMPPWTPTAWASLVTGKNPGKHGVFDMTWRRPGSYEFTPANATVRRGTPFWQRLNDCGLRVGLVNVPFTYPLEALDGFAVAGFGTPSSAADVTFPSEILPWIEQEFGPYEPTVSAEFLQTAPPAAILEKESAHQTQQVQIAAALAKRHPVDVLVINLMLTDHANHKLPQMAQVEAAYCRADKDLGYLIGTFGPDNVLLISDHGSSRLKGEFLLDVWLRDQGYLVLAENTPAAQSAALNWLLVQWLQTWLQTGYGWSGQFEKLLRRLLREIIFALPAPLRTRFWNRLQARFPNARNYVLWADQPDYHRTPAFPGSAYAGLLYLNVIGRESSGVVPSHERDALAAEIATRLRQIREPDSGRPLFSHIYTAEELYSGAATAHAPDLILDSYDTGWNIRANRYAAMPRTIKNQYFVEAGNGRDFGWHSREGMFVFSGPAFECGAADNGYSLLDIPPTLLHLHGVPVPDDYDGRVLIELFAPELRHLPLHSQPGDDDHSQPLDKTFSTTETEELLDHLRALGYVA